jgi:hypothetical protein
MPIDSEPTGARPPERPNENEEICDSGNTYSALKANRELGLSEAGSLTEAPHGPNKEILSIADNLDRERPNEKDVPPIKTLLTNILTEYLTHPFQERIRATTRINPYFSDTQIKIDQWIIKQIPIAIDAYFSKFNLYKIDSLKALFRNEFAIISFNTFKRSILGPIWLAIPTPMKGFIAGGKIGTRREARRKIWEETGNDIGWFGQNELKETFLLLAKAIPIDNILAKTPEEASIERPKDPYKTRNLRAALKIVHTQRKKLQSPEVKKDIANKIAITSLEFLTRLLVRVKDDEELGRIKEAISPLAFYIAHIPHLTQIAQKKLNRKNGEKTTLNTREILDTVLPSTIPQREKVQKPFLVGILNTLLPNIIPKKKEVLKTFLARREKLEKRLRKTIPDPSYSAVQLVLNRMERLIVQEGEEKATKSTMRVLETFTGSSGLNYDTANVLTRYLANLSNKEETMLAESLINLDGRYIAQAASDSLSKNFSRLAKNNLSFFKLFAKADTRTPNKKENI